MINEGLIFLGALMMVYSIITSASVKHKIRNGSLKKKWNIITVLISFFLFGYLGFLFNLVNPGFRVDFDDRLVSIVFFFGAAFVVIVIKIIEALLSSSDRYSSKLENLNTNLSKSSAKLREREAALVSREKELERKNKRLEDTMEDFYMMRMDFAKTIKDEGFDRENKKIRKKIKRIKKS